MVKEIIITGASGFLGQAILEAASAVCPAATVLPIHSPRCGGIDLSRRSAVEDLRATVRISDPESALLIHAGASVQWHSPEGLLDNAAMAVHVATWARSVEIGFCVLVSTVNVYPPIVLADCHTPCRPANLYGLGKWTAEQAWSLLLPAERCAVVRLAGIWGWQRKPTLFWNRILLAAVRGSPPEPRPVLRRSRSRRNYISAPEAAVCLLQVGINRLTGLWLGASRDVVDTVEFVKALESLPGSRLSVDWQDDGETDESLYRPSGEFLPWLKPFPEMLASVWKQRPDWVLRAL